MKKTGMNKLYTGLLLCMACAGLTACGSSDGTTKTSGRLTAISETQIQIEEMTGDPGQNGPASGGAIGEGRPASGPAIQGDDKKKGPVSGGAVGEKPDGTPPADAKGNGKKNGKPDGTPPAGKGQNSSQSQGESKTYKIDSDTKIYKEDGGEKTEISLDEVELGSMISIEADGEEADSIIVKNTK